MNNEQRLLMLRLSQPNMKLAIIYSQLLRLWEAKEVVGSRLDLTKARTRGVWKPHDALEERGCDGVPQLYPPQPSDVPRMGGAPHAKASQGRHMVQRLAGGWTECGHNTPAPRHGGQLQVFDVYILCSTQHHLHFSPRRLQGHLG